MEPDTLRWKREAEAQAKRADIAEQVLLNYESLAADERTTERDIPVPPPPPRAVVRAARGNLMIAITDAVVGMRGVTVELIDAIVAFERAVREDR